ncbi:MAG: glycosyltransferase [Gemmatimonadota bacterium]
MPPAAPATASRPRVTIFCDEEAWGGIVTYAVELTRSLPAFGFDATLVAPEGRPWHQAAAELGVAVHVPGEVANALSADAPKSRAGRWLPTVARLYRAAAPRSVKWLLGSWDEYRFVHRALAAVPADLIHVQSVGAEVAALAARAQSPKCPVISTLHFPPSMVAPERVRSWTWRYLCHRNMAAFDVGIAVSRATLADWDAISGVSLGPPRGRVIYNGSASSEIVLDRDEARRRLGLAADARVLLNVAALMEYKDQATLLTAVRLLLDSGDEVTLVVAGEGPNRPHLEQQVRELGLTDHVCLLGHRSDTATLFAAADLYVQSSKDEAFPMVLLEAGLQGLPVVATDVGGVAELITDGVNGTLVPPENPVEMADGLRRLLRGGELGARHARELSLTIRASFLAEHMVRETAAVYRELLAR